MPEFFKYQLNQFYTHRIWEFLGRGPNAFEDRAITLKYEAYLTTV
jgi:hypothetical protein